MNNASIEFFGAGACFRWLMEGCRQAHRKQPSIPQQYQPVQYPLISCCLPQQYFPLHRGNGSEWEGPHVVTTAFWAVSMMLQSYPWHSQCDRSSWNMFRHEFLPVLPASLHSLSLSALLFLERILSIVSTQLLSKCGTSAKGNLGEGWDS